MTEAAPKTPRQETEQRPNEMSRLRQHGGATVAELREFLGQLKGRSPQEMLGAVADSDLARSVITAAIGCAVLLVALTVVPYLLKDDSGAGKPAPAAARPAATTPSPAPSTTATATPAAPKSTPADRAKQAVGNMGIGESKGAPKNVNPLDGELDKLLDGVD